MSKRISFLLLLCIAALTGCRKDDPQPVNGSPVFHATGTLGSAALDLQAGVNGYYMYSSYASDAQNVYEFKGELKQQSCPAPCPNSLTLRIRDYAPHSAQQTLIDSALAPGAYNFVQSSSSSGYTIAFTSLAYADTLLTWSWDFGDASTSSQQNPVHTYANAGIYLVCLSITSVHNSQSCNSMFCDSVYVGPSSCMQVDFTAQNLNTDTLPLNDSVQFTSTVTGGTGPFTYLWSFGDAGGSTVASPMHNYVNPGLYPVHLQVTDSQGCMIARNHYVLTTHADSCYADFDWQAQAGPSLNLSMVTIEWVDAGGNLYTSAGGVQPVTSSFQVVSVDEYDLNENQQRTKKIHALVTCTLFNGSNSVVLQNADLVFAVAYP